MPIRTVIGGSTSDLPAHVVIERCPYQCRRQAARWPSGPGRRAFPGRWAVRGIWRFGWPACRSTGAPRSIHPELRARRYRLRCHRFPLNCFSIRLAAATSPELRPANLAQVAGVFVDDPLRHLGEPRRRALVVARHSAHGRTRRSSFAGRRPRRPSGVRRPSLNNSRPARIAIVASMGLLASMHSVSN